MGSAIAGYTSVLAIWDIYLRLFGTYYGPNRLLYQLAGPGPLFLIGLPPLGGLPWLAFAVTLSLRMFALNRTVDDRLILAAAVFAVAFAVLTAP